MPNHRVIEEWMGEQVETLEDLLAPGLRAACVGINPSKVSVEAGHYYQGRLGQAFFRRLARVGLLPGAVDGYEDDALFERRVGFTDIIKRPSARAAELRTAEYEHGREALLEKLERYSPGVVIFTYKKSAEILLGKFRGHGPQHSPIDAVQFFVMPGPYEKQERVAAALDELAEVLSV